MANSSPSTSLGDYHVGRDLPPLPLPEGVVSRYIPVNDLVVHFLDSHPETGHGIDSKSSDSADQVEAPPLIVLLHGFPELAFSWRHLMRPLAELGYRIVAPDQRGFGRTVPRSTTASYPYPYVSSLAPFRPTSLASDILAFIFALGYERAACVVGHDFGSVVAGLCALIRPDEFRSVVLMSSPFIGVPDVRSGSAFSTASEAFATFGPGEKEGPQNPNLALDAMFKDMDPPRMHYQHYFSLPVANEQMYTSLAPFGLHTFLRSYFHVKSACWRPVPKVDNEAISPPYSSPRPLKAWTKEEAAHLPLYYLLPRGKGMPEVVNVHHPRGADLARSHAWLSEDDLAVYVREYWHTGFQGGLNRYRCITGLGSDCDTLDSFKLSVSAEDHMADLALFARKKVEVPAVFVAGETDWGPFQSPGALAKMREVCPLMKAGNKGIIFVKNAGHWVQQENSDETFKVLRAFLKEIMI